MPVLRPEAKPDKAMTLDLAALQSANAPAPLQATPNPISAAAAPPAQSSAIVPPEQDPDFAEPQNPWAKPGPVPAQQQSATPVAPAAQSSQPPAPQPQYPWMPPQPEPAPASTVAQASPAQVSSQPATQPSQAAGPPQNPWAALQSQQAARASAAPAAGSSPVPAPPPQSAPVQAATTSAPAAAPASASAVSPPAASAAASAQPKCFTNSEGVKICYVDDVKNNNTTDIHKEGGVNDYHNQASAHKNEAIQGHVPGNNITDTLNHLGENPKPNEHKDGTTVFQGKNDADWNHQQDIHKDKSSYTDHETNSGNQNTDWKSAHRGADGSKEMAEINKDNQFSNEEDTRVDSMGKDKVDVEESKGSDDHRFVSDKPGTENDSSLVWDEDNQQKKQKEEFQGNGVYDLHEEDSSERKVKVNVDGDQGWKAFEQDMKDFDSFFNNDESWRASMQDPRVLGKRDADGHDGWFVRMGKWLAGRSNKIQRRQSLAELPIISDPEWKKKHGGYLEDRADEIQRRQSLAELPYWNEWWEKHDSFDDKVRRGESDLYKDYSNEWKDQHDAYLEDKTNEHSKNKYGEWQSKVRRGESDLYKDYFNEWKDQHDAYLEDKANEHSKNKYGEWQGKARRDVEHDTDLYKDYFNEWKDQHDAYLEDKANKHSKNKYGEWQGKVRRDGQADDEKVRQKKLDKQRKKLYHDDNGRLAPLDLAAASELTGRAAAPVIAVGTAMHGAAIAAAANADARRGSNSRIDSLALAILVCTAVVAGLSVAVLLKGRVTRCLQRRR